MHKLVVAVATAALGCSACGGGGAPAEKGNATRGAQVFADNCASCHGQGGSGGIAPKLSGTSISLDDTRERIDNGASGMPAGLVSGQDEEDVLAYVQQIGAASG